MQEAMAENSIDMGYARPKSLDSLVGRVGSPDLVVTMGCEGGCPVFADSPMEAWDIEDPSGKPIEVMRKTRDKILEKVGGLVKA
jgi:protein-tyrosine-phosphatase